MHKRRLAGAATGGVWIAVLLVALIASGRASAQAGTYTEDFEDGQAQGWNLEPGWEVVVEDGNSVLAGGDHLSAMWTDVDASDNVRLSLRLRLLSGGFHLPFRVGATGRYVITVWDRGSFLDRELFSGENQTELVLRNRAINFGEWHHLELFLHGGRIEFRVDGSSEWVYTDPDPLTGGFFGLEALPDSPVQVDDITVTTGVPVPGTATPGPSPTRPAPRLAGNYQEDFEDGLAQGWELLPGWTVSVDEGNQVLAGKSGGARASASGNVIEVGDFVRVSLRLKLLEGTFHLVLRGGPAGAYFISINNSFSSMNRQPVQGKFEEHIVRSMRYTSPERWQQLEVLLQEGRIEFLVDGRRQWVYTDPDPLGRGSMGLGLVPHSEALVDDIVVTHGVIAVDATPTFGLEGLGATLGAAATSSAQAAATATTTPALAAQTVEPAPAANEEDGGAPFNLPCLGALLPLFAGVVFAGRRSAHNS